MSNLEDSSTKVGETSSEAGVRGSVSTMLGIKIASHDKEDDKQLNPAIPLSMQVAPYVWSPKNARPVRRHGQQ